MELLAVMAVIGVLLALLLPAVQYAREAARRTQCSSNIRMLGLAAANYGALHGSYPAMGRDVSSTTDDSGSVVLSWVTSLLPQIEQAAAFEALQARVDDGTLDDPWDDDGFYRTLYPGAVLACPTDPPGFGFEVNNVTGRLNYQACLGDLIEDNHLTQTSPRGAFGHGRFVRPSEIGDGLSNTVLFAETAAGRMGEAKLADRIGSTLMQEGAGAYLGPSPTACARAWSATTFDLHLDDEIPGSRWADGRPYYAGVVTAASPNGLKCGAKLTDAAWGVFTAGSRHRGGCFVALCDGSVRFISESIDAGNAIAPSQRTISGASPYGVWGALGTRAGGEPAEEF